MKITDKLKSNWTSTLALCQGVGCRKRIRMASNKAVIKNRNDTRFWGLTEKFILCGDCLEREKYRMPTRKKYLWNEYQKRGYWKERE